MAENPRFRAEVFSARYRVFVQGLKPVSVVTDHFKLLRIQALRDLRPFTARHDLIPQKIKTPKHDDTAPHRSRYDPDYRKPQTQSDRSIQEAFAEQDLTLDDLTPYRIKVAYRIVRFLSQESKAVHHDEPLHRLTSEKDWHIWRPSIHESPARKPITLLPPQDPEDAADIDHYIQLITRVYDSLGIVHASYGEWGWKGLSNANTIQISFPSRQEIIAFEHILIQDTLDRIVEHGTRETRDWLETEHGLTTNEIADTFALAKFYATEIVTTDIETDQKLMVLRHEDQLRRAREAFDIRAELMISKQLAVVQGITKVEPQDLQTQITSVIKGFQTAMTGTLAPVPDHVLRILPPPAKQVQSTVIETIPSNE